MLFLSISFRIFNEREREREYVKCERVNYLELSELPELLLAAVRGALTDFRQVIQDSHLAAYLSLSISLSSSFFLRMKDSNLQRIPGRVLGENSTMAASHK